MIMNRNRPIPWPLFFWVLAVALPALEGCGRNGASDLPGDKAHVDSAGAELFLYCGAGIRPPVEDLVKGFEKIHRVKTVMDFAGSQVLFSKIKLSGRGDLYLPGDKHYIDQAAGQGLILYDRTVCYFMPAILVQKGNPKKVQGLEDLLREGMKLGLGNGQACAIGKVSRQIFAKNNLDWARVERTLAFQSMTVNELGLQIQSRALDAVIVWDAIARYYEEYGEMIPIPAEANVISTVNIGVLKATRQRALADRFVGYATSEEGRAVFLKHGYRVDPPE